MIIMIQTLQRWTEYFTCNRYSVSSLWINQWQCHCFIELQCLHSWFSIWIHIEKNRTGVSWSCVSTWLVIRVRRVFFTFIVVPILCEITDFLHKTFLCENLTIFHCVLKSISIYRNDAFQKVFIDCHFAS